MNTSSSDVTLASLEALIERLDPDPIAKLADIEPVELCRQYLAGSVSKSELRLAIARHDARTNRRLARMRTWMISLPVWKMKQDISPS